MDGRKDGFRREGWMDEGRMKKWMHACMDMKLL